MIDVEDLIDERRWKGWKSGRVEEWKDGRGGYKFPGRKVMQLFGDIIESGRDQIKYHQ